jgi:hypothetical protein
MIDIVLYDIDQTIESIDRFATDRTAFLDAYRLAEDERRAFEAWDYGTLYAMGAHPFLLFQVVRSLAVRDDTAMPQIIEQYRQAISPHGAPDYIT